MRAWLPCGQLQMQLHAVIHRDPRVLCPRELSAVLFLNLLERLLLVAVAGLLTTEVDVKIKRY